MADIAATAGIIDLTVKGITIVLMIIAASMAIKKKNNLCLGVAIVGNLAVYLLTQSPLLCWIVSSACIIWASSAKSSETGEKKKIKAGNIIGLIIGIGLVAGPLIGYLRQEASLKDPTTQGVLILFAVIGGFMIINNIFKLLEGGEASEAPSAQAKSPSKASKEEPENKDKVRCRFCKKMYDADYNGCPYCKKK